MESLQIYSVILFCEKSIKKWGGGISRVDVPTYCIETTTDREKIGTIIRECDSAFAIPISEREIYRNLLKKLSTSANVIYAYREKILGYAVIYTNNLETETAFVSLIAVRPQNQNIHIGTKLMQECFSMASQKGMKRVELEVKKNNHRAIEFYKVQGFVLVNKKEESYILRKNLF